MVDNLFEKLASRRRHSKIVPFKLGEETIPILMVQMNSMETGLARRNAERKLVEDYGEDFIKTVDVNKLAFYHKLSKDYLAYETLFIACRQPNNEKAQIFPSRDAICEVLNSDEVDVLVNHYLSVQESSGVVVHIKGNEQERADALLDKVIQDGLDPLFFYNSLTSDTVKILFTTSVCRLQNLRTETSSPTQLPENTSTNENDQTTKK